MDGLQIGTQQVRSGTQRVTVRGELDSEGGRRVERALLTAIGHGATEVIVDVTGCDFVDSTALGLILSPRLSRFGTRFLPVASDCNILQLLQWQAGAEQRAHG